MKRIISFLLFFAFAASQLQAQNITDPVTLRNLTNQWVVPGGSISAVKLNSLLNGVLNVQAAGDSTLLILIKKWSDSVTIHNQQVNGVGGTPVNLELADYSANNSITLNHAALSNTLVLMKNGSVLPPFKYSVNGALVRLVDPRIPADIFLSNYKF